MQKGFTLIELLIVIAIAGILSAVVVSSYQEAKRKETQTEEEYCMSQGKYTIKNLPAKCVKYYLGASSSLLK